MSISEQLTIIRNEKGMTITQIAKLADLPMTTVSRIFSGETASPSVDAVGAIASVLNVSVDEILGIPPQKECQLKEWAFRYCRTAK